MNISTELSACASASAAAASTATVTVDRCSPSPEGGRPSSSSSFTVWPYRRLSRECPSRSFRRYWSERCARNNRHQWATEYTRPRSLWRSGSEKWVPSGRRLSTFDNGLRAFFSSFSFFNFLTGFSLSALWSLVSRTKVLLPSIQ